MEDSGGVLEPEATGLVEGRAVEMRERVLRGKKGHVASVAGGEVMRKHSSERQCGHT